MGENCTNDSQCEGPLICKDKRICLCRSDKEFYTHETTPMGTKQYYCKAKSKFYKNFFSYSYFFYTSHIYLFTINISTVLSIKSQGKIYKKLAKGLNSYCGFVEYRRTDGIIILNITCPKYLKCTGCLNTNGQREMVCRGELKYLTLSNNSWRVSIDYTIIFINIVCHVTYTLKL